MNDKLDKTQNILRSSKLTKDEHGRTILTDAAETQSLELMSTQMLQALIDENSDATNKDLRQLAEGESGLVVRDTEKDSFKIISDDELNKILRGSDPDSNERTLSGLIEEEIVDTADGSEELDLVSTQMLRIALNLDDKDDTDEEPLDLGFDPYNKS